MKLIFSVILLICLGIVNKAQTFENSFGNSIETLSTINLQDTLTKRGYSFEPLIGFGIPPFKILAGAGYYINDKFEITIKYTSMFLPNSFDIDVISTGIRMHENIASGTLYFFDLGAVMNKKTGISESKINGAYFEGGLGYMFKTNIGFNTSLNFRIGEIVRSGENPLLVVGVDLIIGWLIKI
ncbi:MAG: hypothetical protein M5U17_04290 [Ignavibacterium sp.]|nr:hypothetical protein [Ignavibacterium sp.]